MIAWMQKVLTVFGFTLFVCAAINGCLVTYGMVADWYKHRDDVTCSWAEAKAAATTHQTEQGQWITVVSCP